MSQIAYSLQEATAQLGLTSEANCATVTEAIRSGTLPSYQVGTRRVVMHSDLLAYAGTWTPWQEPKPLDW